METNSHGFSQRRKHRIKPVRNRQQRLGAQQHLRAVAARKPVAVTGHHSAIGSLEVWHSSELIAFADPGNARAESGDTARQLVTHHQVLIRVKVGGKSCHTSRNCGGHQIVRVIDRVQVRATDPTRDWLHEYLTGAW